MKHPVLIERVFIDERLQKFRLRLLIPISVVLSALMTAGAVLAIADGTMGSLYFSPLLCVIGTWASVYMTAVRRKAKLGYTILAGSVLMILVVFPFLSPEPLELYLRFGALIYSLFVLLIVLSGLFGVALVAKIATGLFYLQYGFIYALFEQDPTWGILLNTNFTVPLLSVAIIGFIAVRHQALVESMIRDLLEMQDEKRELTELSSTDSLTGLYNRRFADSVIESECARVARYGGHLSCLMIDADLFKQVNDMYGHHVGDDLLRSIGQVLRSGSRQSDVCARYGGEEFMILTPDDASSAKILAERVRSEIEGATFAAGGEFVSVTVSIGVSGLRGEDDCAADMVKRADTALCRAKQGGRNRVEVDSEA